MIPDTARAARWRQLAPIGAAIGVALLAFAYLDQLNPPFLITDDGVRDQLLVRDCTELAQCHRIGAATSLRGFHQGAVWLDLLVAVRLLGGDTATQRTVVLALLALSVATLFLVVWRWLRPSIAWPAAVILLAALSLDLYPSLLINPSPSVFPDIVSAAALLCYALSGQRRFLVVAAFALAVAINVHVGALALVPAFLALGVLVEPRPWRPLVVAGAVLFATSYITSSAALRANLYGLAEHGRLLPGLAGGALVILLSAGLGPRFRRLSWDARAWLVGGLVVLPFTVASAWLVVAQRHDFGITYLHPVLGPGAVIAATVIWLLCERAARSHRALGWMAAVAAVGAIGLGAWQLRASAAEPGWTLAEAAAISEQATQLGASWEDLVFHVQGRSCRELLAGMSILAPAPGAARHHGNRQLQVVKLPLDSGGAPPDSPDMIRLGPARVAVIREIESWLRPEQLTACRIPVGSDQPARCTAARPWPLVTPERYLFGPRSYPEIHGLDQPPPFLARYQIPLSPVAGDSRVLVLLDDDPPDCRWQITAVDGVRAEGGLPARRVQLRSEDGRPGVITLEKPFGTSACTSFDLDRRYPPCVFEAAPGDPLAALVETSR